MNNVPQNTTADNRVPVTLQEVVADQPPAQIEQLVQSNTNADYEPQKINKKMKKEQQQQQLQREENLAFNEFNSYAGNILLAYQTERRISQGDYDLYEKQYNAPQMQLFRQSLIDYVQLDLLNDYNFTMRYSGLYQALSQYEREIDLLPSRQDLRNFILRQNNIIPLDERESRSYAPMVSVGEPGPTPQQEEEKKEEIKQTVEVKPPVELQRVPTQQNQDRTRDPVQRGRDPTKLTREEVDAKVQNAIKRSGQGFSRTRSLSQTKTVRGGKAALSAVQTSFEAIQNQLADPNSGTRKSARALKDVSYAGMQATSSGVKRVGRKLSESVIQASQQLTDPNSATRRTVRALGDASLTGIQALASGTEVAARTAVSLGRSGISGAATVLSGLGSGALATGNFVANQLANPESVTRQTGSLVYNLTTDTAQVLGKFATVTGSAVQVGTETIAPYIISGAAATARVSMAAVERIINGTATTVFYMTDKAYELAVATINEIGTRINDIRDSVKDEVGQAESAVLQLNVESKKIVKLYRELKALGVDVNNMEEEKQPIDYKARQQETVDARKEKMASRRQNVAVKREKALVQVRKLEQQYINMAVKRTKLNNANRAKVLKANRALIKQIVKIQPKNQVAVAAYEIGKGRDIEIVATDKEVAVKAMELRDQVIKNEDAIIQAENLELEERQKISEFVMIEREKAVEEVGPIQEADKEDRVKIDFIRLIERKVNNFILVDVNGRQHSANMLVDEMGDYIFQKKYTTNEFKVKPIPGRRIPTDADREEQHRRNTGQGRGTGAFMSESLVNFFRQ